LVAGIPGMSGYRDGDFHNTMFNQPEGIVYFKLSELALQRELSKRTIVLSSNSTGIMEF
jgi:hypothetical protein